jgi:hypothetical protein
VCIAANNSHTVGGTLLETSISFAASFAAEKVAICKNVSIWQLGFSGSWSEPPPNKQFSLCKSE